MLPLPRAVHSLYARLKFSRFFVVLAVCGVLAGLSAASYIERGSLFFAFHPSIKLPPSVEDLAGKDFNASVQETQWSKYLDAVGVTQGYKDFEQEYYGKPYTITHNMGHLMGDVLYKKLGLGGISVCDGFSGFSCFHQLFLDAVVSGGPSMIPKLADECSQKYGAWASLCDHGIGHGAVELYGDTVSGLTRALQTCSETSWGAAASWFGAVSCEAGALMEYQHLLFAQSKAIRPLDVQHPAALCGALPASFQEICYRTIAQWWLLTPGVNFQTAAEFCRAVQNPQYRYSCFFGIGNQLTLWRSFDLSLVAKGCAAMAPGEERACRVGAAANYVIYKQDAATAASLCPAELEAGNELEGEVCYKK